MKRRPAKIPAAPMLAHFTRASKTASGLDNLIGILQAGVIRASRRMIWGGRPAVSLFDVPLDGLAAILDPRNRRRYEAFGIAIDKRYAFRMGARPVIYIPRREAERILPPEEHWRAVATEMDRTPPLDWTYEREWRMPGDLPFEPQLCAALVASWNDADEIFERFDGRPPCAGVIPIGEMLSQAR